MSNLKRALSQAQPPGIYSFETDASLAYLKREAEQAGWRLFSLNGNGITDKATFLEASARALDFPSYSGKNWDAFEESINDLDWVPASGYVLLFRDPEKIIERSPRDWETALDILKTASSNWRKQGVPFYVLLQGDAPDTFPKL